MDALRLVGALSAVLLIVSCGGEQGDGTSWQYQELMVVKDPPAEPPILVLLPLWSNRHFMGNENPPLEQTGKLLAYDWHIDGELVSTGEPWSVQWPPAIGVPEGPVAIDLGTTIEPVRIEVRLFGGVDSFGVPVRSMSRAVCEKGGATGACRLHGGERDGNWFLSFSPPAFTGTVFVSVWASWYVPVALGERLGVPWPTFQAAWGFVIEH